VVVTTQEFPLKKYQNLHDPENSPRPTKTLTNAFNQPWRRKRSEQFKRPSERTFAPLMLEVVYQKVNQKDTGPLFHSK
jgi:hypothetical protein